MPRPSDENYIQVELFDEPIEMNINKIQAGRRAPVSEQARFDLVDFKGLAQKRVLEKLYLPDGKVVCRAPVRMHRAQFFGG